MGHDGINFIICITMFVAMIECVDHIYISFMQLQRI